MVLSIRIGHSNAMVSLSIFIVFLTICTASLQSVPRAVRSELFSVACGNQSNRSTTADSTFLAAATSSLNLSGRPRITEAHKTCQASIAAGALLLILILGAPKSHRTLCHSNQDKQYQDTQPAAPCDLNALPPSELNNFPGTHQDHSHSIHPRPAKKAFPNASSCCPIPSEPRLQLQSRTPSRAGRKRVTFDAVHIREIEWAPLSTCCEHGIPDHWECSIGAHYSFTVDAAEYHREQTERLTKGEYIGTSHGLRGPKQECEYCRPGPKTPPAPPPSPEPKVLAENEVASRGRFLQPENIVALNSQSRTMTELYFKEKLQSFAADTYLEAQ